MTPAEPDPPVPTTVAISPMSAVFLSIGDSVRMIATVSDQYGQAMANVAVVWNSSNTAVATVTEGLVTAVGNGTTSVAANAGEAKGEAKVAVTQSAASVILTPAADSMVLGDTLRLSVEAWDANGHSLVGTTFSWSSSDESVATVDSSGLVRGVAEGTATISAAVGSAHGTAQITVSNPDRAALVALYVAAGGPNWINSENWLTDAPLRDWYGVRTAGGRVTEINLRKNGLAGRIPPEIGILVELVDLDLTDNGLAGPIPRELGQLTRLRWLTLDSNALTGPIPPDLGNTSLEILYLDRNELSGAIPPELGKLKNLKRLWVSENHDLRGEIPPDVLALNLDTFHSHASGLCVPRTGDFDSYIRRDGWVGYACGETEPGFQIQLLFHPDVPDEIRDAMNSQAEYWMEILRDTEVPDLFGVELGLCFSVQPWTLPSPVIDDILVTVEYRDAGWTYGGVCYDGGSLRHRIPFNGYVDFDTEETRHPYWLELLARRGLGHALGIGSRVWGARGQVKNPSTSEEARDTYVVSPLAEEAFDAAGGTSYPRPKIPLEPDGSNGQWRASVFGSELMSAVWFLGNHIPTSAVTLQALADLGYTVDLSYADPFTLRSTAASATLGADELGWEAPPVVVSCRPRVQPDTEQEGLSTGLLPRPPKRLLATSECQVER